MEALSPLLAAIVRRNNLNSLLKWLGLGLS